MREGETHYIKLTCGPNPLNHPSTFSPSPPSTPHNLATRASSSTPFPGATSKKHRRKKTSCVRRPVKRTRTEEAEGRGRESSQACGEGEAGGE